MEYLIVPLLDSKCIQYIRSQLASNVVDWQDGRVTAGTHAIDLKSNEQLHPGSSTAKDCESIVHKLILLNQLVKSYALIQKVHGLIFTRTNCNGRYGWHVDNPFVFSGRRDLSFTIFISSTDDYEGGSLSLQSSGRQENFRLNAGEMILYPSSMLHSVQVVTSGERLVCVGWIQSYVRSMEDRLLLFNLDAAARGLLSNYGQSDELDLIFQVYANAVRRLAS